MASFAAVQQCHALFRTATGMVFRMDTWCDLSELLLQCTVGITEKCLISSENTKEFGHRWIQRMFQKLTTWNEFHEARLMFLCWWGKLVCPRRKANWEAQTAVHLFSSTELGALIHDIQDKNNARNRGNREEYLCIYNNLCISLNKIVKIWKSCGSSFNGLITGVFRFLSLAVHY